MKWITIIIFIISFNESTSYNGFINKVDLNCDVTSEDGSQFRPPAFPDIREYFSDTIQFFTPELKPNALLDQFGSNDSCNASIVLKTENFLGFILEDFNAERCDNKKYTPIHCPLQPTTTLPTTTTTTTTTVASTLTSRPHSTTTRPSSTHISIHKSSASTEFTTRSTVNTVKTSGVSSTQPPLPSSSTQPIKNSTSPKVISTSSSITKPVPATDGVVVVGGEVTAASTMESKKTNIIMVASIVAGAVIILVVVIVIFVHRKQLCARRGVPPKHSKFSRQRSDCIPISPPSPGTSEPPTPSMLSVNGSIGLNNPGYEFDTQSQASSLDSKYHLLSDQASIGFVNMTYHSGTLKAIEHPHALNMGGFGESSTDLTLTRKKKDSTLRKSPKLARKNGSYLNTMDTNHNNKNVGESNPPFMAINIDEGKDSVSSHEGKKKSSKKTKKADRPSGPKEEWNKVAGSEMLRASQQSHVEDLLNDNNSHLFSYGDQDMSTFGRSKKKREEQMANAGPVSSVLSVTATEKPSAIVVPEQTINQKKPKEVTAISTNASVTSLPGSTIIEPPPEFQDLSIKTTEEEDVGEVEQGSSSGYSSGVAEEVISQTDEKEISSSDPPTAIVQPSVKDLKAQFESCNDHTLPRNKANGTLKNNNKSPVKMTSSVPTSNGNVENGLPASFLWTKDRPQSNVPKQSTPSTTITKKSLPTSNGSFLWTKPTAAVAPNTESNTEITLL